MARPATALIDLAASREPDIEELTPELVQSAVEHRMEGLLYTWAAARGRLTESGGSVLSGAETRNWAQSQMLASHAVSLETDAAVHGVDICFFKGIALESQAYTRLGERPTTDLDVIVRGGSIQDVARWVTSLQPRHLWIPELEALIAGRHIQAIDLIVNGVQVDLHFDPLKLEIVRSNAANQLLARLAPCDIGTGTVTSLDPEASMFLALLHLNKDRFRRLISFADVRRILDGVQDWDWVFGYAHKEGLSTPILASLEVVTTTLGIEPPVEINSGPIHRLWRLVWPQRTRLLGREGVVRFRYRQMLLPLFAGARWWEAIAGLSRRLFPPAPMLRAFYPDVDGAYLKVLVLGRTMRRFQRARQRRESEMPSTPDDG